MSRYWAGKVGQTHVVVDAQDPEHILNFGRDNYSYTHHVADQLNDGRIERNGFAWFTVQNVERYDEDYDDWSDWDEEDDDE